LGRWLRQTSTGRLVLDKAAIAAEAKLDGKYLLSTSDQHLTPAEIALGYKNMLVAERGFRDHKKGLLLRPVFHRLEPRILAHRLICWLALLLTRSPRKPPGTTGTPSPPNVPGRRGHPGWPGRHRGADERTHRQQRALLDDSRSPRRPESLA
jgi:hypothetical protein